MQKSIADYMNLGRTLSTAAQNHLRQLLERYPYFHAARMLYLRSLYQSHDPSFGAELRKAALYVPSRQTLYELIEGDRLKPTPQAAKPRNRMSAAEEENDRTNSLIGQFLDSIPKEKPRRVQRAEASTDYLEFLRQSEGDSFIFQLQPTPVEDTAIGDVNVIDKFLNSEGKIVIHNRQEEDMLKPVSAEDSGEDSVILTEMMAKIYIKQGKYDKALEIIRKLFLKYPKKNRYFADQIRFLEKVIVNNNNK